MRRAERTSALFLVLAALLLGSCVKLEQQPVDKRFYALEVARSGAAVAMPSSPATLLVRRMQVSPRVAGRELVYRTGESAWTADYYNLFFVAPADMLTQDLRAWLSAANLFANVVDPASLVQPAYVLEGNVSALHGDFAVRPAQAVVEMQFLLLKVSGGERSVVLTRELRRTVPLAASTPAELVRALRQGVAGVNAELETALREASTRK
ncbi:MAG: ABC-type transport auxiliary lipoprotein family protein [Humidesulfovibrio sp.]|nr:ABC-type transport auxiliary lipoprotein family protein [Humidesulfovibrio sp.]